MRALLIVLPILLVILLLLFARVGLILSYQGRLTLSLRYLFLRFSLYPRQQKTKKEKKKRSKKKKRGVTSPAASQKKTKKPASHPRTAKSILFLLRVLRETLEKILEKASRHVRIRIRKLHITIGGEKDAARAAIEYGLISQAVAYLLAYLENTGLLRTPHRGALDLRVNFTEREYTVSAVTEITCSLIFLIPLLLSALMQVLKARSRWLGYKGNATSSQKNTDTSNKENQNG